MNQLMTSTGNNIPLINYIIFFIFIMLFTLMIATKWGLMQDTIKSGAESPSQKRLVIFFMSLLVIAIALAVVLLKAACPDFIWWGVLGIVATGIGATVWEKVQMNKIDKSVITPTPAPVQDPPAPQQVSVTTEINT